MSTLEFYDETLAGLEEQGIDAVALLTLREELSRERTAFI